VATGLADIVTTETHWQIEVTAMPNEQIREAASDVVLARTAKRWNRIHPTGFLGKLFRPLFGSAKVEAIFVVEYNAVDESQTTCEGNPICAWRVDKQGNLAVSIDDVDTGPVHGNIWHRQLVAYSITADGAKVLVNEWDGPGNGRIVRYAIESGDDGIRVRFRGASGVMGGAVIG
jgi:hypothetical protein